MELAGGPQGVAICGTACAGIGRSGAGVNTRAMLIFEADTLAGCFLLGGRAGFPRLPWRQDGAGSSQRAKVFATPIHRSNSFVILRFILRNWLETCFK